MMINKKQYVVSICLSLLVTVAIAILCKNLFYREIIYYAFDDYSFLEGNITNSKYSESQINDLQGVIKSKGYKITEAHGFTVTEEDPYLLYETQEQILNKVVINFLEPLAEDLEVKVYVSIDNADFNESYAKSKSCSALSTVCEVSFTRSEISQLRIDIGDKVATNFKVNKIVILDAAVSYTSFKSLVKLEMIFLIINVVFLYLIKISNRRMRKK